MADNRVMIALGQFEDLIRDSEKIRILEELAKRSNGKECRKGCVGRDRL